MEDMVIDMKKSAGILTLCFVLILGLTGCTYGNDNKNVAIGMKEIEALNYQGALDSFTKALEEKEDAKLVYRGQGLAYMGLTRYEEAKTSFETALAQSNGKLSDVEYDVNYYLATTYYKLGEMDSAIKALSAIIELKPKEKTAYYLRGTIELEQGSLDKAILDFDKAISLDAVDYEVYINIYESLEKAGNEEKGQEYLNKALKTGGENLTDFEAGKISYYLKDYETARNRLEIARTTGGEAVILLLGKTYEALEDKSYAATVYKDFLEKDNFSAAIYNQLGLNQMNAAEYQSALEAFQSGIQIEGNELMQTLKFNEIVAYEFLEDYKKATVLMESYLAVYPDDAEAKREYEFLKSR